MVAAVFDILLSSAFSVGFAKWMNSPFSGQKSGFSVSLGFPTLVFFVLIPVLTRGSTLGQLLVRIKMVNRLNGSKCNAWNYFVRFITLYLFEPTVLYLNIFAVFGGILWAMTDNLSSAFSVFFFGLCFMFVFVSIWLVSKSVKKNNALPHTAWSKVRFVNR